MRMIILLFCILLAACSKASINANFEEIRDRIKDNIENNLSIGINEDLNLDELGSKCDGMVFVEGGSFIMARGSTDVRQPPHEVTISSFYMAKCELRLSEWASVMGANSSELATLDEIKKSYDAAESILVDADAEQIVAMVLSYLKELNAADLKLDEESIDELIKLALLKLTDDLPVLLNWYAAVEYCNKRSLVEGLTPVYSWQDNEIVADWNADGYRLPTEAEWEYAAQGGKIQQSFEYSGSDDEDAVSWHDNRIHLGASKEPNTLGIYDMSGNVGEWCWDWESGFYLDWEHYTGPDDPYILPPYGRVLAIKPLSNPVGPSYEQVWSMVGIYEARNESNMYRIARGGGPIDADWDYPIWFLSTTYRNASRPEEDLEGLRVVRRGDGDSR